MTDLVSLLKQKGPMIGKELCLQTRSGEFSLWRACSKQEELTMVSMGSRYLRLDRQVEGYARLSPSIMREFSSYTVTGHRSDSGAVHEKASALREEISAISRRKLTLAADVARRLVEGSSDRELLAAKTCFIIAGDVVYNMAHAEPRPEQSTGELVRGSDLDVIVVTENLPPAAAEALDAAMYREKHNLLVNPALKEELDYLVKDIETVQKQLSFAGFKNMVAAKILHEGCYLYGSRLLFEKIKEMLVDRGIPAKIGALEEKAARERLDAEAILLGLCSSDSGSGHMNLFYTTEEKEEIF